MTTYDSQHTLDAITANAAVVVVIGGLSIVAMLLFFLEAARMRAGDRIYPMALWMTAPWSSWRGRTPSAPVTEAAGATAGEPAAARDR